MKILKGIFLVLLVIIFSGSLIATSVIGIFNSFISKDYVITKIKDNNSYEKLEEFAYDNVEQYLSGEDEIKQVLEQFVTKENMETITNTIFDSIYDDNGLDLNEQTIKVFVDSNVDELIEKYNIILTEEQKNEIDNITNEVIDSVEIEENLKIDLGFIPELIKIFKDIFRGMLVTTIVFAIFIILLNINNIFTGIKIVSSSIFVTGGFFIVLKKSIIDIILKNSIVEENSEIVFNILNSILSDITKALGNIGMCYVIVGVVAVSITLIIELVINRKSKINTNKQQTL